MDGDWQKDWHDDHDGGARETPPSRRTALLFALIAVVLVALTTILTIWMPQAAGARQQTATPLGASAAQDAQLAAYYLDVGQGDAEFIELPDGETMLIDAGTAEAGPSVVGWLQAQGVTRIDHVVATHPHEDHIGGMADVLASFEIGDIWMPQGALANTETFLNLLQAIDAQGLSIHDAYAGESIASDDGLSVRIISPQQGAAYDDLNDYSAEILITYGQTTFLFTGDASTDVTLAANPGHVDVLKVAHHGSDTGTSAELAAALTPRVAIISCSADNSYGHPTQQTLDALSMVGAQVFATFANGVIRVTSDGADIQTACTMEGAVTTQEARGITPSSTDEATQDVPAAPEADAADAESGETVYITDTGTKYHRDGCSSLSESKHAIRKSDAIAQGYEPCKICNP